MCRRQRTACRSWLSPFTMWVLGTELKSSDLAADSCLYPRGLSPTQKPSCNAKLQSFGDQNKLEWCWFWFISGLQVSLPSGMWAVRSVHMCWGTSVGQFVTMRSCGLGPSSWSVAFDRTGDLLVVLYLMWDKRIRGQARGCAVDVKSFHLTILFFLFSRNW